MPELSVESETEGLKDFWWQQIASNPLSRVHSCCSKPHPALDPKNHISPQMCFSSHLQFRLFITAPPNLRVLCLPSLNPLHPASHGILFCVPSTDATVAVQPQKRSKSLNPADADLSSPPAAQHIFSITQKLNWPTLSFYFNCTTSYADYFSLGISNKTLVSFPRLSLT